MFFLFIIIIYNILFSLANLNISNEYILNKATVLKDILLNK